MKVNLAKWTGWPVLIHSLRTAITAVASLLVARLFRLPESWWAPITTQVIAQSSPGRRAQSFRPAFYRHGAGSDRRRTGGHLPSVKHRCLRHLYLHSGAGLCTDAHRLQRLSFRRHCRHDCASASADGPCMASRLSSLCRGFHRHRHGPDPGLGMAGTGIPATELRKRHLLSKARRLGWRKRLRMCWWMFWPMRA